MLGQSDGLLMDSMLQVDFLWLFLFFLGTQVEGFNTNFLYPFSFGAQIQGLNCNLQLIG